MTKMGSCYCDDYDGGGGGGDYHFQDDEEEDDVDNDDGPRGIEPCQNCFQHSQGVCIADCEVSRGDPLGHPMAHLHAVPQPTAKQWAVPGDEPMVHGKLILEAQFLQTGWSLIIKVP